MKSSPFAESPSNDSPAFGLLPEQNDRRRSFAVSSIANIVAMVIFLVLSLTHLPKVKPAPVEATALTFELPKPHIRAPRIRIPAPTPRLLAKLESPKRPSPAKAAPTVTPIQSVRIGAFTTVRPTVVANIHSAPTVKVGAFGNPMGARTNPYAQVAAFHAPVLGTFGGVPGEAGTGSGAPHRGVGGGVRTGGFGTTPGGGGGGTVQPRPAPIEVQPVTVTYSIRPTYTSEARSAGVQGEVVLRVRFAANGRVEVLSVLQSLGHGLDQSAENAVSQYRFLPATRNGQPVDQTTTVHVRFQLAA